MKWAHERSINAVHQESQKDDTFGVIPEWVKLSFETFTIHYQFQDNCLETVTLQVRNA
jgi:hypothetical protein